MKGKYLLVVVSFLAVTTSGCRELNSDYCQAHRDDPDCALVGDKCGNDQCRAPTPVCKADTTTCVECVEAIDCASTRPICSAQNTCVECEKDSDCASELCLSDGTCADPKEVAHVGGANASDNSECTVSMPCKTLQQALMPIRRYIKATGMITNTGVTTIDRKTVSIFGAPDITTITRSGGGSEPVLDIRHESVVTLVDLEISGGADGNAVVIRDAPGPMVSMTRVKVRGGMKDNGIQMSAGKLEMINSQVSNALLAGITMTGGSLIIRESQILDNMQDGVKAAAGTQVEIRGSSILRNRGTAGVYTVDSSMVVIDSSTIAGNTGTSGGLSIKGPLEITNNIISSNGLPATSAIGGVSLESMNAKFAFNTVADNNGSAGGITCLTLIDLSNSIFTGTSFSGVACNVTHSLTGTSGVPIPMGMGNKTGQPMFQSTSLSSPLFYRIGATSDARDSADPAATLEVDIDGQTRTDRRDMGADEFK